MINTMIAETLTALISIIVVLFVPGYFLSLAFFTKRSEIDSIERITLSFVFSITFLPLLVLVENLLLEIPINFTSVAGNFLLIIVLGLIGYFLRTGIIPNPAVLQRVFPPVPKEQAFPLIPKMPSKKE